MTDCATEPILVPRKQAALLLGISIRAVDYLTSSGRLRCRRIGGRVLFSKKELHRFAMDDHDEPLVPVQMQHAA